MWSRALGSTLQYEFFRLLVRLRLVGLCRLLLRPVSFYYALRPDIRRRCRPYLERRFGPAGFFTTLARTARLYANFADALFDRLLTGLGGRLTVEQCGVGRERMRALLDEGRGALVVSAHFGSWQSALIGMEEFGRPIAILQWVMEENPDSRYLSSNGSGHAFTVINAREGMTSTIRAAAFLRAGGIVCIMGDRMTPNDRHFVTARFLGGSVRLPAAPYLLASLSGAPVVHAFSVREGGRVRVLEPEIVRVPAGLRRHPELAGAAAQHFISLVEDLTRTRPFHFFNFYDMWDQSEGGCDDKAHGQKRAH